ncbi:MAG: hypothetical protein RLZZ67_611 [Candidatus Parcubacteria bacterium]|jgi:hypothetical protein
MKTKINLKHLILPTLLLCLFPVSTHAARIYVQNLETPAVADNETVLKIMIDTEGKEINALEGVVVLDKKIEVTSIDEAGSVFTLWARKPSLTSQKISFTGGTTGGVYGSTLKVFTVRVKPLQAKPFKVSFEATSMFLNDGKGTKVSVTGTSSDIPVLASGSPVPKATDPQIVDSVPPSEFSIDLGKDPTLYNGKYFVSFYALDRESGISTYEVTETNFPPVRSGSTYVLQNQKLSGTIVVKATDKAGNVRIQELDLNPTATMFKTIALAVGIIIAGLYGLYFFLLKKK